MIKNLTNINADYTPGQPELWTGRKINIEIEPQFWYQHVSCASLIELQENNTPDFGLIGYACDEGVKRNLGRLGAVNGPKSIRKKLGNLPLHFNKTVVDFGDVACVQNDLESCQKAFVLAVSHLVKNGIFLVALGGGHDIAYAHFKGLKEVLPNKRIGIINFDAHFDLRPLENAPNSGTPFYQLLSEFGDKGELLDYFAIGIQKQSNTKQLFEIAKKHNVNFVLNDSCCVSEKAIHLLKNTLKPVIENNDHLYITIDMDGFSSAYVTGVSAPSPRGFTPSFIYKMLAFLFSSKKVIACDIAELNPKYDTDGQSASLAARLIDHIISLH